MTTQALIDIARGGREYVRVAVHGELDLGALDLLRDRLATVVDDGGRYLTVDLSKVVSCHAAVVEVLAAACNLATRHGGWLSLTGIRHLFHFRVD